MANFIMLMKDMSEGGDWNFYIEKLISSGKFRGGSSLGNGVCVRKESNDGPCSVTGIIRLEVENLEEARELLAGNPAYEAGSPIELLEEIED